VVAALYTRNKTIKSSISFINRYKYWG